MPSRRGDLRAVALWAAGATVILQLGSLPVAVRAVAGVPLVVALPGYALGYALLGNRALGWPERTALSLALSLTATILGTLVLDLVSLPLSTRTWSLFLGTTTVAACAIARAERRAPRAQRRTWRIPRLRDAVPLALAVAIAAAAIVLARTPLHPPRGVTGYTQLWAVPLAAGVEVGVANRELEPVRYRLDVSGGAHGEHRWTRLELSPGQQWTRVFTDRSLGRSGEVLTARLYRADRPGSAYRHVRVRLDRQAASRSTQRSPRTP